MLDFSNRILSTKITLIWRILGARVLEVSVIYLCFTFHHFLLLLVYICRVFSDANRVCSERSR